MKIKELILNTNNLREQYYFYKEILGLKVNEKTEEYVRFQIGRSELRLIQSDNFQPYHFAINIPSNKEAEALDWLKSRLTILKDGKTEVQDFDFWNAKAIYFYDNDRNIVEFIARKNLNNQSEETFDINSICEISEIGMPVSNIESAYNKLNELVNIQIYDGGFERFCAVGDETGLFICINKHKKDWFPTGDKAYSSAFKIKFEEKGNEYELAFENEVIFLS